MKYLPLFCLTMVAGYVEAYNYDWENVEYIGYVQPFLRDRLPAKSPSESTQSRIIGRFEAKPHQFPWQALNKVVYKTCFQKFSKVFKSFVKRQATVSGWGKEYDASKTTTPVLRYVTNQIISNERCTLMMLLTVRPSNICLSGSKIRGSCNGDSGGSLTINDTDKETTQIGIVSFGLSLGCENIFPSVLVRVTSYLDFIENHSDVAIRQ